MVQSIKIPVKSTCKCAKPYIVINSEQVGVCKICGGTKIYPDNRQLDDIIKRLRHRNYIVGFGIPKDVFSDLKNEIF